MEGPINQRRLSDISFKIDKDLNVVDGNRNFLRLLHKTEFENINLSCILSETDSFNFKTFLSNYKGDESETSNFIVRIRPNENLLTCIFTVKSVNQEIFEIILEELSYSRELLDKALLESREYTALLQNFDAYYFIFNGSKFILKNTKDLNTIFSGTTEEFKVYFETTFKLNLRHNDSGAQYRSMFEDLEKMEANKYYNFLLSEKKPLTVHTLKTQTRSSALIVGSINQGKKSDPSTNLYSEKKDGLTGLYNKKAITELAVQKINEEKMPCSLIIIDVDKFKECNDTYGHIFGDRVLVAVSSCIKDAINGIGIAGRIGGDEFMIILDRTEEADIRNVTRNIRTGIQWSITSVDPESVVTCSMGIARFPSNAKDYDGLFKMADKCLYIAKERGRNCYIIYKPEIHDKVLAENEYKENKISSGKFYFDSSNAELNILSILSEQKGDFVKTALDELLKYLNISKITVYDSNFKPFYILGADQNEYRKSVIDGGEYFKFFNEFDFLHLDNTNVLDSINSQRYDMYNTNGIASTIEVNCKDENGNTKALVCYDLYRPARTFAKEKITFAIVVAKMIAKYI
ncbi:MAG: GGDEF domain-containing protein [Treponema sp.]|nr:GGDEF domain-containing protein [Candidatus Treponema equifaecale]